MSQAGAKVTGFDQAFAQEQYPFATEVMDVADAWQVAQVCQRLLAETERLDVLVNAAGILRMGATDQLSKEDWQQTFAVNVGGAFNRSANDEPVSPSAGRGDCHCGVRRRAHAAYWHECLDPGASKAALKKPALSVGLELAGSGVPVMWFRLAAPPTGNARWASDDAEEQRIRGFGEGVASRHSAGENRPSTRDRQHDFVPRLDLASHITLQDIVVDGGSTLGA
ncbi:SDR family NAD(P)-dependent oxidoreductase [Escherichia coli]